MLDSAIKQVVLTEQTVLDRNTAFERMAMFDEAGSPVSPGGSSGATVQYALNFIRSGDVGGLTFPENGFFDWSNGIEDNENFSPVISDGTTQDLANNHLGINFITDVDCIVSVFFGLFCDNEGYGTDQRISFWNGPLAGCAVATGTKAPTGTDNPGASMICFLPAGSHGIEFYSFRPDGAGDDMIYTTNVLIATVPVA